MTKATKQAAVKTAKTTSSPGDAVQKIGKAELVAQVGRAANLTGKEAGIAVAAILDVMADALRAGQSVGLPGLGTLSVKATAARTGVRPGTAEKIQIAAGRKVSFKIANDLKQVLKD